MSSAGRYTDLSDDQLRQVHVVCQRFEQALRNGDTPSIESQIETAPQDVRSALFRELLAIELESRRSREQVPAAGEYEARFPARL